MAITLDIKGLEKLDALPQAIERASEKALDRGAKSLLDQRAAEVSKTYKRAIPRTKSGKPKWKRSGDLQRGQEIVSKPGEREIHTTGNAAKPIKNYPGGYAEKLQTMPVSKDGVARANPYPENAAKAAERNLERIINQEFKNALT